MSLAPVSRSLLRCVEASVALERRGQVSGEVAREKRRNSPASVIARHRPVSLLCPQLGGGLAVTCLDVAPEVFVAERGVG